MQIPEIHEPKCTVVSFIPFQLNEEKPGLLPGKFIIPEGSEDKPSITIVSGARHYVYLDGDRGSLPVRDASHEVARSICEDFSSAQLGISEGCMPGIFWVPGEMPWREIQEKYPELIISARISHKRWMHKLIEMADDDWNRYKKHSVIADFQRTFADILKIDPKKHEWMNIQNVVDSLSCPSCGTSYREGVAVCTVCKCVLDKEKYAELEFAS